MCSTTRNISNFNAASIWFPITRRELIEKLLHDSFEIISHYAVKGKIVSFYPEIIIQIHVKYLNLLANTFHRSYMYQNKYIFLCLHLRERKFKIQRWVWLCWLSPANEVSESCARWKLIVQPQNYHQKKISIDRWIF